LIIYYYRRGKKGFIFKIDGTHLCIIHNRTPKNEAESLENWAKRQMEEWIGVLTDIVMQFISRDDEFGRLNMTNILFAITKQPVKEICSMPNFSPHATHLQNDQNLHMSIVLKTQRGNIKEICQSEAFLKSKMLLYHRKNTSSEESLKYDMFTISRDPTVDEMCVLPSLTDEALVMDVTGKALFWLNPSRGDRDTAILLEKKIPSLEIICN
jgi:hypothetical protein